MNVFVPIDGSECSYRALEFAIEFARRHEGSLHVVHFVDEESESTREVLDRAEELLAAHDVDADVEVLTGVDLSEPRYANQVGREIIRIADDYDHVVMGHHGTDTIDRLMLGSAAETVLRAAEIPVTVIP